MKNWFRVLSLAATLAIAGVARADAWTEPIATSWWYDYGTCHLTCGEESTQVQQSPVTLQECCTSWNLCPDQSFPTFKFWEPFFGSSEVCTN